MRLWAEVPFPEGRTVKAYVVRRVKRGKCLGFYDSKRDRILVQDSWDVELMKSTLVHELLHAFLSTYLPLRSREEELLIRHLEPIMYKSLCVAGWLNVPPPPRLK